MNLTRKCLTKFFYAAAGLSLCAVVMPFHPADAQEIKPGGWNGTMEIAATVDRSGTQKVDKGCGTETTDWMRKSRLRYTIQVDDRKTAYKVTADFDSERLDNETQIRECLVEKCKSGEDFDCEKEKVKITPCRVRIRTTQHGHYDGSLKARSSLEETAHKAPGGGHLYSYKVGTDDVAQFSVVSKTEYVAISGCTPHELPEGKDTSRPVIMGLPDARGYFSPADKQVHGRFTFSPDTNDVVLDHAPALPADQLQSLKRSYPMMMMNFRNPDESEEEEGTTNKTSMSRSIVWDLSRDPSAPPLPDGGATGNDEQKTKAAGEKWEAAQEKLKAKGIVMPLPPDQGEAAGGAAPGSAAASGSKMTPGLWEYNMKTEIPGMPFALPPITTKQCVRQADVDNGNVAPNQKGECQVKNYQHGGGKMSYDSVCAGNTGHYDFAVTATTLHGTGTTQTEGRTIKTVFDGKRLEACK